MNNTNQNERDEKRLPQEIIELIEKAKQQNKFTSNLDYKFSFSNFLNLLEDTKPSELLNEIDNYILRENEITNLKEIKELFNELLTKIENFTSTQPKPQLEKYNKPHIKRVILLNDRTSANIFNESEETKFKLRKLDISYKVVKKQDYKLSLEDRLIYSCVMTFKLKGFLYFNMDGLYFLTNGTKRTNEISQQDLSYIKERLNFMRNTYIFVKTKTREEKEFKGKLLNLEEYEYFNKQKKKKEIIYFIKDILFFNLLLFLKQKDHLISLTSELLTIKQPSKKLRELNYYLVSTLYNMSKGFIETTSLSYKTIFEKCNLDYKTMTDKQKEKVREWIKKRLELYKDLGLIKSYQVNKGKLEIYQ